MQVETRLILEVDDEANFIECTEESTLDVLMEMVKNAIYDIDDVKLEEIELEVNR
jgi:hypothetical protein